MNNPKYSAEVIRRYREMQQANSFMRKIEKREPVDLDTDEMTLGCGHKARMIATFIDAAGGKFQCQECKEQWLANAVKEDRRDSK